MQQYLGWIPPNSHIVLEFDCGRGDWGAMFKAVQPQCCYIGIERNPVYREEAAKKLDVVLDGNNPRALTNAIAQLPAVDCVIYHAGKTDVRYGLDIHLSENGQTLIFRDNDVYGFPWRIAAKNALQPMDMVSIISEPACAFMRMIIPNSFYKTRFDINVEEMDIREFMQKGVPEHEHPYVLILQRILSVSFAASSRMLANLTSGGGLLIHEFDDWPERWGEEYRETHYMDFVGSHVVQTTTPALADYFQQYNPYVLTFPNELCSLPAEREESGDWDEVTIFYCALNRQEDWQEIMPLIGEAIERYGTRLNFKVLSDREFYEALPTRKKTYIGEEYNEGHFVPYKIYEDTLHTADIALLPLRDTMFNRMKSDLKFIEAAGHGAAVLASAVVYENTVEDGTTGLIYHDGREFRQKLFQLIENKELRYRLSKAAYAYVKHKRLMCQHYEERIEIYRELLAKRTELEAERQRRIAALEAEIHGNL